MKIYKYVLEEIGIFRLELPKNAQILSVQTQNEKPVLWALVDPDAEKETRNFMLALTGQEIRIKPHEIKFIGTYQTNAGTFVGHLFEILSFREILKAGLPGVF